MLEIKDLYGGYGKITILNGTSFTIPRASITTVIGPNGAGKSTVFKAIFGLLNIHSGQILLDGMDVTRSRPSQMIAHGVTYVPQGRNIFAGFTVEETAGRLGYSETAAFSRAYSRWNGHPPSRRKQ